MKSHELAKVLLSLPDRPVSVMTNGHLYDCTQIVSHGPLRVGELVLRLAFKKQITSIIIGNLSETDRREAGNYSVERILHTDTTTLQDVTKEITERG